MIRTILRGLALALAALCFLGAGMTVVAGVPFLLPHCLVAGVLLVIGVAFERWRYKPPVASAGPGFVATPERFIDIDTGRPVQVFVHPASGERRYVDG